MKKTIAAAILAFGVIGALDGLSPLGAAIAQEQATTPETRARAIVAAISSTTPGAFEAAAQQNYTPALLARNEPAVRAQRAQQVASLFGPAEVTNVVADGNTLRVSVRGQTGLQGLFTMTFEDAGERRISEIHFQASPTAPAASP